MLNHVDGELLKEVLKEVAVPGTKWITSKIGAHIWRREFLNPTAKVLFYFIRFNLMFVSHSSTIARERMLLLYAIMTEKSINMGKIISKEIRECAAKRAGYPYFLSLITLLCLQYYLRPKVDLKARNHQGHIIETGVARMVGGITRQKQPMDEPSETEPCDHPDKSESHP